MSFSEDLDRQRAQVMRRVRHAANSWAGAMRSHVLAPPDAGFAGRLKALSEAPPQRRRRFLDEARAAMALKSPYVVRSSGL